MMMYDVKPHVKDIKGLKILIDIVDSLHSHKEVKIIQEKLQKTMRDPEQYICWPKAEIDNIFIGPSGGDWADEKNDRGYGAIKPVFRVIKDLMFKQNSEYPELAGGEEW